jgi:hypothetical protein
MIFCGCDKDNSKNNGKSDDFVGSKWVGYYDTGYESQKTTLDFPTINTFILTTEIENQPPQSENGTYTKDGSSLTMYYGGNIKPIKGTITNNGLLILEWWTVNGTRTASLVKQ